MFDHRIPQTAKTRYGLIAGACLLAFAGIFAGQRYWIARHSGPAASAVVSQQPVVSIQTPTSNASVQPVAVIPDNTVRQLAILVFKSEKRVEVWAYRAQKWSLLREYPVIGATGSAGPKLIEGDRQIPEGIYRIAEMNPHSRYHMSCKLDYPNAFDRKMAEQDGRVKLGGDVCLQGKAGSNGCIALGDPAMEDLYALIERTGRPNAKVIIAPNDLREHIPVKNPHLKILWIKDLYVSLCTELKPFAKHP